MRIAYHTLFRIRLRHTFYASGESTQDFQMIPTPQTQRSLERHGFVFRHLEDGCAVYAEVEPGTTPLQLYHSIAPDILRWAFWLRTAHPHVVNISQLPAHLLGKNVFYFNNLGEDQEEGRLHLRDNVDGQRVGTPLLLVTGDDMYTHRFQTPVQTATIEIHSIFQERIHSESFRYQSTVDPISEFRVQLRDIQGLVPGRYRVTDDQGGSQDIYYDPEVFGSGLFGVIEIFNRTEALTTNNTNQVPSDYQFLHDDELTSLSPYYLQFEARATTWRYHLLKKYPSNSVSLSDLDVVADGMSFEKVTELDRAVFTASNPVLLHETPRVVALHQGETAIKALPSPRLTTGLQSGSSENSFLSEMYVNV